MTVKGGKKSSSEVTKASKGKKKVASTVAATPAGVDGREPDSEPPTKKQRTTTRKRTVALDEVKTLSPIIPVMLTC